MCLDQVRLTPDTTTLQIVSKANRGGARRNLVPPETVGGRAKCYGIPELLRQAGVSPVGSATRPSKQAPFAHRALAYDMR
jgi:hypothetical protein